MYLDCVYLFDMGYNIMGEILWQHQRSLRVPRSVLWLTFGILYTIWDRLSIPYGILCHGYSVPKTVCPRKAKPWQGIWHVP